MQRWKVDRVTPIAPIDFADCDAAYLLRLTWAEDVAETVVEFAAPSAVASGGYAEEALSPFLGDTDPPRHIVVDLDGSVRVVQGPAAADPDRPPRAAQADEPRRARNRGRR